jgi:hypothetical protein
MCERTLTALATVALRTTRVALLWMRTVAVQVIRLAAVVTGTASTTFTRLGGFRALGLHVTLATAVVARTVATTSTRRRVGAVARDVARLATLVAGAITAATTSTAVTLIRTVFGVVAWPLAVVADTTLRALTREVASCKSC